MLFTVRTPDNPAVITDFAAEIMNMIKNITAVRTLT